MTVQLEGSTFSAGGCRSGAVSAVYFTAWPDRRDRLRWRAGIAYLVVRPTLIRYSDFDQRPPVISEFT